MRARCLIWALAGFLVACGWIAYSSIVPPEFLLTSLRNPAVKAALYISCPLSAAGAHHRIVAYWFPPVNAVIYALVGLVVEILRRRSLPLAG